MARILVVNNVPHVRALLEALLRSADHLVTSGKDGTEAFGMFRSEAPDVVIIDGQELTPEAAKLIVKMRRLSPVPIIAILGKQAAGRMLPVSGHLGAVSVIKRPFSREELLKTVDDALRNFPENNGTNPNHQNDTAK